jgi:hypothetical protein
MPDENMLFAVLSFLLVLVLLLWAHRLGVL